MLSLLVLHVVFGDDIRNLGADDFCVREDAETRLVVWADLCWPLLDRNSPDCEVRRRSRRIIGKAIPQNHSPIALLGGRPMTDWIRDGSTSIGTRPGLDWQLGWIRPDPFGVFLPIIWYYEGRCKTQHLWKDWHSAADSRNATAALCRDMLAIGVPPPLIRLLCEYLKRREKEVSMIILDNQIRK